MEEFSILERKVKDLLNRYESILAEHRALTENISFLNKVKLELETKINSFKEEKTILETDKRNIIDNLNNLKEERDNLFKQLEAARIEKDNFKLKILRFCKKVPLLNRLEGIAKKYIGSTDYKNASEMMRKVLVKHVNTDISDEVTKIKCPSLLIWGTMDAAVSLEDGKQLEKLIPNAGLVIYDGCTHYAYLERLNQTINVLRSFIESEE